MVFSTVGNFLEQLREPGNALPDTPTYAEQLRTADWYTNRDLESRRVVTNTVPGGVFTQQIDESGSLVPGTQKPETPETVITRTGEDLFPEGTTERLQEVQESDKPETTFQVETELSDIKIPGANTGRIITSVIAGILVLIIVYVAGQLFNINIG